MAELKIISMDEVQSKEVKLALVSVYPIRENHNHSGRSRRGQNNFGFEAGGASLKRRSAAL